MNAPFLLSLLHCGVSHFGHVGSCGCHEPMVPVLAIGDGTTHTRCAKCGCVKDVRVPRSPDGMDHTKCPICFPKKVRAKDREA